MSSYDVLAKLVDLLNDDEEVLTADGFDEALLGIGRVFSGPYIAVYDRAKCIDILMEDMSYDEAEKHFQFNVEGTYVGPLTPMFMELA